MQKILGLLKQLCGRNLIRVHKFKSPEGLKSGILKVYHFSVQIFGNGENAAEKFVQNACLPKELYRSAEDGLGGQLGEGGI